MYEAEANQRVESADQIPLQVRTAFRGLVGTIAKRTTLPWSEHCTECAWPTCYTTCDLYAPRPDGRCRRFVDGMVRIDCPGSVNGYLTKVRFKRWGKLWSPGVLKMHSVKEAAARETRDQRVAAVLHQITLPAPIQRFAVAKRYSFKKRMALRGATPEGTATCFVMECLNPSTETISLTLSVRSMDGGQQIPFQRKIDLPGGFRRVSVPFAEIARLVDLHEPFGIEVVPNEIGKETTLYFGFMDFIQEVPQAAPNTGTVKCVVWDLDNTLWDGVLVEDGLGKLRLKPRIADVIRSLDQRGILQSVASKNNADEAMSALRHFHLDEFFLEPQISWNPKSAAIQSIAKALNIGSDTMLFVDDSEFERSEVRSVCPEVETFDAQGYLSILSSARCDVPITEEGKTRRKMYQTEQQRQVGAEAFRGDYRAFLRDCEIEVKLASLTDENLERVHELTQRTNQMNFSGNRYDRAKLAEIQQDAHCDTYVISCADRFGNYGIVGFGVVDDREPRLTDLMFSCRIQAKRVEHAVLCHILATYRKRPGEGFYASYRKTARNLPSGQVFEDVGMRELEVVHGVSNLFFAKDAEIPDDGVIRIAVKEPAPVGRDL